MDNVCNGAAEVQGLECAFLDTSLDFGFADIGASAQVLKDAGVKVIYAAMDLSGCVSVLRSLIRADLDHLFHCGTGFGPAVYEDFGDFTANSFFALTAPPSTRTCRQWSSFVDEFTTRKPGVDPATNNLEGWIGAMFVVDVLEELGPNVTREGFIETVRTNEAFSAWDADGLKPSINWTSNLYERYLDPDFAPDPDLCTTFLMRPDIENQGFQQVGAKPRVCLNQMLNPEDFAGIHRRRRLHAGSPVKPTRSRGSGAPEPRDRFTGTDDLRQVPALPDRLGPAVQTCPEELPGAGEVVHVRHARALEHGHVAGLLVRLGF